MYHKCTHETSKQRILDKFSKANSVIRCIVATVALGMGIDIPDVWLTVHICCPKSIISYWQEAGRCARDGQQGFSVILYDNFTASLKTTDKAMTKLVKNADDQCLRKQIIDVFFRSWQWQSNTRAAMWRLWRSSMFLRLLSLLFFLCKEM